MKRFVCTAFTILLALSLSGCVEDVTYSSVPTSTEAVNQSGEPYKLAFIAEFYDNNGKNWLTTKGSRFNISPNKVKEYSYDSNGFWISEWTMSSVVSIDIDGNSIDTCGSTVLLYSNYLVKQDCVLPADAVNTISNDTSITVPSDIRTSDAWTLNWWWITKDTRNYNTGKKIVVIQSQEGNPICLFSGNQVTWELSRNLPKTTEITIDGAKLYVHRANFAIIDKSMFN